MSLNSRQARQSVPSVGRKWAIHRPEPNNLDAPQRQNIGWNYAGFSLVPAVTNLLKAIMWFRK